MVSQEGYVVLVGDVFYWPHCPEYATKHLVHTILLKGYDPKTAQWSLLDDNPASLLCAYTYPEELIAAGFDNNELRRIRYFTTKPFDAQEAGAETRQAFSHLLERYQDSYTLLSDVGDLISCPWIAPERVIAALHDAFSVYQGSRAGLGEYVRRTFAAPDVEAVVDRIVGQGEDVMNQLLLGKVTGSVDAGRLTAACHGLKTDEQELLGRLRAVDGARGPV